MHQSNPAIPRLAPTFEYWASVIFGAAHGIGQSISAYLSSRSPLVLAIDRDPSFSSISVINPDKVTHNLRADVTEPKQLATAVSGLRHQSLELAFFCAGIQDDSQPERTHAVNVQGTINCFDAVVPYMKPGALLVFLSSDRITFEAPNSSPYVTSKRAIADFANDLAQRRPDLKVLTLLPGPVDTALFRLGKSAEMIERIEAGPGILSPIDFTRMLFEGVITQANSHSTGAAVRMYKRTGVEWMTSV